MEGLAASLSDVEITVDLSANNSIPAYMFINFYVVTYGMHGMGIILQIQTPKKCVILFDLHKIKQKNNILS